MKKIALLLFLSLSLYCNAQISEMKFGKISPEEISLSSYAKDSTADAVILFDKGKSSFTLSAEAKFQYSYNRHCRIKIFRKSAYDLAEIKFRIYKNDSQVETLEEFKAICYNMVNGKLEKNKINTEKVLRTEENYYTDISVAIPDVKEGSIIEYSYSIKSDFLYEFRDWTFQNIYPTIYSEYNYVIPEYFDYRKYTKGYLKFDIDEVTEGSTQYNFKTEAQFIDRGFGVERIPGKVITFSPQIKTYTLAIKDVPAFKIEPNISCMKNYLQSVEFELKTIKYPEQAPINFAQSWESINQEMLDNRYFGQILNSDNFIKETVDVICLGKTTNIEKAQAIYSFVQQNMKWNKEYNVFCPDGIKKAYTAKVGTSAEINFLLIVMLKAAGLNAYPVLFSTRDNGYVLDYIPRSTKFNSVLTKVEIAGINYLLDPCNKFCPFGLLPKNDLNGKGRVVNNTNGEWIDLESEKQYKSQTVYNLKVGNDGIIIGNAIEQYSDYAAIAIRSHIAQEKSADDFIRVYQEKNEGLSISNYKFANLNEIQKPFIDTITVEFNNQAQVIGDKIIINPMLICQEKENIYKLENRLYPIDYNFKEYNKYVFNYTIPEGYMVETLPQSEKFKLADGSIEVQYISQSIGNKISIIFNQKINKVQFLPDEYKNLKELYNIIVKKQAEQIILKKAI